MEEEGDHSIDSSKKGKKRKSHCKNKEELKVSSLCEDNNVFNKLN